jgi:hypothetical protein
VPKNLKAKEKTLFCAQRQKSVKKLLTLCLSFAGGCGRMIRQFFWLCVIAYLAFPVFPVTL